MSDKDEELLKTAQERFKQCVDDNAPERRKQLEDLIFCDVEQWPEDIRASRENDINGIRPCLTIDKINQYINQVVNNLRQNKPSIKVRPIDSGADVKTAEVFQGIIRSIEDKSSADIAYLTAGESSVKIGEGYFRLITDYIDENSFDQEILIIPVSDTFSCYLGPHELPDGSDAEYGFVIESITKETFERDWPDSKSSSSDFNAGMQPATLPYWTSGERIRIAEYFYFDYEEKTLLLLEDGSSMFQDEYDDIKEEADLAGILVPGIKQKRKTMARSVKWCKLNGVEILDKKDWLGSYIPIVKVVGKTSNVNGRKGYRGLVRNARDSLRAYNYWFSTITEKLALSPKTPLIGAVGQFDTHRDKWANANKVNYPFLEYDPIEVNGMALPAPQRQAPAPLESAMISQLQVIEHDIQTALGMFKESVGQSSPQQSGKALMALQSQSDTGVFHFQDNLAMAVRHCGRIIVDLAPKIYDAPRIMRMLGEDGENSTAQIDPSQPQAKTEVQDLYGNVQTIYNLGVGRYDVTTISGPSYATKRMEQADMMLQITQSQPEMMQTIGDLLFKSMDWPMADKISERLKKMLPPQLLEQEDGQPAIPPQIQQAIAQIEQQNNELQQKAQALSQAEEEVNKKSMAVEKGTIELLSHEAELKNEATKLELDKYAFELDQREKELASSTSLVDSETKLKIAEMKQETEILLSLHKEQCDKNMAERNRAR